MPRKNQSSSLFRNLESRLIDSYPLFVKFVLEQIQKEEYGEDGSDIRGRAASGISQRGQVKDPANDRRLKRG